MMILLLAAAMPIVASETQDALEPSLLMEIGGQPMIERLGEQVRRLKAGKTVVVLRREDARKYHLDSVVSLVFPDATIMQTMGQTAGAACSALLVIEHMSLDDEILIVSVNEFSELDFAEVVQHFRDNDFDAGVVCFPSIHPRYSYVRLNASGLVVEATEKKPISRNATAGFYWFRKADDFISAVKNMIRKDAHVDGNFYICPALNELILEGKRIGHFSMPIEQYHPLKSARQIEMASTLPMAPLRPSS